MNQSDRVGSNSTSDNPIPLASTPSIREEESRGTVHIALIPSASHSRANSPKSMSASPLPEPSTVKCMDNIFQNNFWQVTRLVSLVTMSGFGGDPAHIGLFQTVFVDRHKWLTQQEFLELFSISQGLPGPPSTQLLYGITLMHGGFWLGLWSFFLWTLPTTLINTFAAIGVGSLSSNLPGWLLALENGLTSAAVGIVALAGFRLAMNICLTPFESLICTISTILAINFNAYVWLFPVLIVGGGIASYVRDSWGRSLRRRQALVVDNGSSTSSHVAEEISLNDIRDNQHEANMDSTTRPTTTHSKLSFTPTHGWIFLGVWVLILGIAIYLRTVNTRPLQLFGTIFVAGSLIFGGGPVLIPLLQSSVVQSGWLSQKEFLIGIALSNALPGPNFSFASFCGALAMRDSTGISFLGGVIGFFGIYLPAFFIMTGIMPLWQKFRRYTIVQTVFDGMNAAAVGLVLCAVYLMAQIALVSMSPPSSLANDTLNNTPYALTESPYYLSITAGSFTAAGSLSIPPPIVILVGGGLGIVDWLVSGRP